MTDIQRGDTSKEERPVKRRARHVKRNERDGWGRDEDRIEKR